MNVYVRFWAKTKISHGCWIWTAGRTNRGYGAFYFKGRTLPAHRMAWLLSKGPIHGGTSVLHRCDNPPCVNPAHLFLGTQLDNMRDKVAKGRQVKERCARKTDPSGANNGNAKLTAIDVLAIRSSSRPQRALAREYGVTQAAISLIVTRKNWAHI